MKYASTPAAYRSADILVATLGHEGLSKCCCAGNPEKHNPSKA